MKQLFLWFYCLPILDAVTLVLLATAAFCWLRQRLGETKFWKIGIFVLFCCWLAVIFWGTLGQRTEGGSRQDPVLMPFYSYYMALSGGPKELYRTNFMNAVLFYPGGLLGCQLLPRQWSRRRKTLGIVLGFLLLSAAIEYCQYRYALGLAETDDVIHNTLGALAGALAWGLKWNPNRKQ